eukprot:TRINITY_DN27531_c0_g1_i1.p1 TRINITY_DN27531_c0_g1~~TRINITY_DN27531_c0_g1_i1.p1  ORF type:complete len:566 (+),score=84.26 TRINITY_DN27531_c0_g1_i1:61-1698(+)
MRSVLQPLIGVLTVGVITALVISGAALHGGYGGGSGLRGPTHRPPTRRPTERRPEAGRTSSAPSKLRTRVHTAASASANHGHSGNHPSANRRRPVEYVDPQDEFDPAVEAARVTEDPVSSAPVPEDALRPSEPHQEGSQPKSAHWSYDSLLAMHKDPEDFLPFEAYSGDDATHAECMQPDRAMQKKCYFRWLMVKENTFTVFRPNGDFPNPIYPADDQTVQLAKPHHGYHGHRITVSQRNTCEWVVRRPVVFLFRLSGHSPYHLWENNLGPFHATLQQWTQRTHGKLKLDAVSSLLVSYVDRKPAKGPKAPHLLDTLLQSFSDEPLINASQLRRPVCFEHAFVGISSRTFNHWQLIRAMQLHVTGQSLSRSPVLPEVPRVLWVSRNHRTVKRGRKIGNEPEVVAAVNASLLGRFGRAVEYLHMQDYPYSQQVRIMMGSQILLGPHGAGIANCIWMPRGSVAMEFAAPKGKSLFGLYHQMCKRSDVTHLSFVAAPDPQDTKADLQGNPRLFSNMVVPVEWMKGNLSRALDVYGANRKKYGSEGKKD